MRIVRLLWLMISVLMVGTLVAPAASAEPPMRLPDYVTDRADALNAQQRSEVSGAVQQLYDKRGTRLWVVYVDSFSGADPRGWAENTWRQSFLGDHDAILAVAIEDRAYALLVPKAATGDVDVDKLRRDAVEPKLHDRNWAGAAVAAADGLRAPTPPFNWVGLIAALAAIGLALAGLIWWVRRRRGQRRKADLNAAQQADATDANALATMSLETLEDLSKSILVEVDNAVRTSDNELALALGEFGERDTAPFITALQNAKAAMAQAFSVRQTLDDAVPEPLTDGRLAVQAYDVKAGVLATVRAEAFAKFADALEKAAAAAPPAERGSRTSEAYLAFALKNPHAYRIMFDIDAPLDEKHPELGPAAERAARYITRGAEQMAEAGVIDVDPTLFGWTMWAAIHGIVMLHQSGMLAHGPDYKALSAFLGTLSMKGAGTAKGARKGKRR